MVRSVSCPAPENALLEDLPSSNLAGKLVTGTDEHPVPIASWQWTPLSPGSQPLPRATLTYNGSDGTSRTLVSPPFEIVVANVAQVQQKKTIPGSVSRAFASSSGTVGAGGSGSFDPPCVRQKKQNRQTDSSSAETLASLRHAEYTSLFPRSVRLQRLALERKLDLGSTLSVPPAAWKPVAVIGAVLAFFNRIPAPPDRFVPENRQARIVRAFLPSRSCSPFCRCTCILETPDRPACSDRAISITCPKPDPRWWTA